MLLIQTSSNVFLLMISLLGIVINRKNILVTFMCLELVFLSLNIHFVVFSIYFDDIYGQLFSLFILTLAASEASLGLAILILYYRIRGSVSINQESTLRL